jgi:predicted DNA repair protein MutK
MSVGLIALLDDVATLAKAAAASLDDVAAQATKAGAKAAGVVIDDTAVTPRYVTGLSGARELPIIGKIAVGSLKNKLLILLPAALLLSLFLPQAITPLLMIGGIYLSYEGTEKVFELLVPHAAHQHVSELEPIAPSADSLEDRTVAGAIKTDFILSAEIMAITLGAVPQSGFWTQTIVLAIVGLVITIAVYGVVALIVKADDAGVALARTEWPNLAGRIVRRTGRMLVSGMPLFLTALGAVGTAAMIWVGGGIVLHGLEVFGIEGPSHLAHDLSEWAAHAVPAFDGFVSWVSQAVFSGLAGLAIGAVTIPLTGYVLSPAWRRLRPFLRRKRKPTA